MEADEPSLYSRREKLSLQYAIRLAANPSNPAHEVTFPPNYVNLYEQKPKAIKSFGIRISPLLESANIKPQNIEKHFTPNIPAWCMKPPEILFDLHSGKKSESNPHILKDDFRKMQSRYKNYQQIYTDGSKEDSKVGCAVISDNHSNMQRIPDDSSIFTAEAKAVDLALDFISTCDANNKFIIVSGAHFTQGTILIVIIVSSGSAKSRTHQSAVGGFLVTRRGWPGRLRACRIWTFINSV